MRPKPARSAFHQSGRIGRGTPARGGPHRSRRIETGPPTRPRPFNRRTPLMAELIASTVSEPAADEHEVNRRLRAQYAEIAQLAGGLAHEIRNPLSTMSLNLDLLAEDFQDPETPRDRRVLQKV